MDADAAAARSEKGGEMSFCFWNVGDRIVSTRDGRHGTIIDLDDDDYGHVVRFDDGEKTYLEIDDFEGESALDYNLKCKFLQRSQSLLREFDVYLIAHKTDVPISIYYNNSENPVAHIGKEINKGCGVVITADNVME